MRIDAASSLQVDDGFEPGASVLLEERRSVTQHRLHFSGDNVGLVDLQMIDTTAVIVGLHPLSINFFRASGGSPSAPMLPLLRRQEVRN